MRAKPKCMLEPINSRVAFIDFYTYHTECIYPQLKYMQDSGYTVDLYHDVRTASRMKPFQALTSNIVAFDFKKLTSFWKLRQAIARGNYDRVVFNTASGSAMLKFALMPLPRKPKYVGTIHNLSKLTTSFGQKLITRKLKHYFVLDKYLLKFAPQKEGLFFSSFSPAIKAPGSYKETVEKPENEFWLTIPGSIEYKRRDYDSLLKVANFNFEKNVRFILLGNSQKGDGPDFLARIEAAGVADKFITFDGFVPDEVFNAYIKQTDALLTLIHPWRERVQDYLNSKISGTFTISKLYGLPMFSHSMLNEIETLRNQQVFYSNLNDFVEAVNNFIRKNIEVVCSPIDYNQERLNYIRLLN